MPRFNPREVNPSRYAKVKAEQDALKKECSSGMTMARLCPYCDHKIEILYRGTHGAASVKCPNCGESIFFPPVAFRTNQR